MLVNLHHHIMRKLNQKCKFIKTSWISRLKIYIEEQIPNLSPSESSDWTYLGWQLITFSKTVESPLMELPSICCFISTCEGGERKPARVFSVKPARKMISNIDYPIKSHLSNMPTFFWAKTRQIRGADTPRGRNVPGKEAGQRQTKWHTVWCAISICQTWPRR